MIRHIASIGEVVEDIGAAVDFYRDVLGLAGQYEAGSKYAGIKMPGTLHYAIWDRAVAAEATFGDSAAAPEVPLGFTVEFEVDDVDEAAKAVASSGWHLAQPRKTEEWGEKTSRFISPGGLAVRGRGDPVGQGDTWLARPPGESFQQSSEAILRITGAARQACPELAETLIGSGQRLFSAHPEHVEGLFSWAGDF